MTEQIIKIKNLSKDYGIKDKKVNILKDINFNINKGDIVSISGPSGSGKSTLLNLLGLLDSDYSGEYFFLDKNTSQLNSDLKNSFRNNSIGFVHQFFHLIPELNVLENVSLPHLIKKNNYLDSLKKAKNILFNFGLSEKIYSKPNNLSGGEQQRVAIARALINNPDLIIADEMTGNLDENTAESIFNFFLEKIKNNKQTLIYVTHNNHYAKKANRMFKISQQKLIFIK